MDKIAEGIQVKLGTVYFKITIICWIIRKHTFLQLWDRLWDANLEVMERWKHYNVDKIMLKCWWCHNRICIVYNYSLHTEIYTNFVVAFIDHDPGRPVMQLYTIYRTQQAKAVKLSMVIFLYLNWLNIDIYIIILRICIATILNPENHFNLNLLIDMISMYRLWISDNIGNDDMFPLLKS